MATGAHGKYYGSAEFILETTYGTTPPNPAMQWIGLVQSVKNAHKVKTEDIKYLKANSYTTGRTDSHKIVQTGEDIGIEIEYIPQVGNMFVANTTPSLFTGSFGNDVTAPYQPTDTPPSYSIGIVDKWTDASTGGDEYILYKGMIVSDMTLTIPEEGALKCKATLLGQNMTTESATYIGTGSHASENSGAPLGSTHISDVQMRATAGTWASVTDIVNAIEIKISNKVLFAKDLNSSLTSKINAAICTSRDVSISLDVDWSDYTKSPTSKTAFCIDDVRSFQSYDIGFKVEQGATDYYIVCCGAKFPELPFEYSFDDICGDKMTSLSLEGIPASSVPPIQVATALP